ncbi:EscU/YscU/HrcU family type III secretion system export apparatus switch protein [Breznakiella homolactica]|uniref:EscU/YscU/HrcU family type III secretion system export apparatus switch protein n=1 Tax=Breznakiella homolactica TaxID=2798577 RepID=UPI001CBA65E8|nr:EscU/YscU/HrcU family type III secretion system export apparatus switch protein [Breznakiella homolactica]
MKGPGRKKASALMYTAGTPAPQVIAKGSGRDAELIVAAAEKAGVEVVEDPALAALLDSSSKVGEYIPEWCWEAVAKILAFVISKEQK